MLDTEQSLIQQFYQRIDELLAPYFQQYRSFIQCKKGCTECCEDETGFKIRQIEADEIIRALQQLPSATQSLIQQKIQNARHEDKLSTMPCPMLVDSACSIYASRPTICRVFGLLIELRGQKGSCRLNFNDIPQDVTLNTVGLDSIYDLLDELNNTVDRQDIRQKIALWLAQASC